MFIALFSRFSLKPFKLTFDVVNADTPYTMPVDRLRVALLEVAKPGDVPAMEAYMRHHFRFLGVKSIPRRAVLRQWINETKSLPADGLVTSLWNQPYRELHYCAIDLLEHRDKRPDTNRIELYERLLTSHAWWDSVDPIATKMVGHFFKQHPQLMGPVTSRWMASQHLWLMRTCLLFQLKYKQDTDQALLEKCIFELMDSREFFVQKAIGWALRTYARSNAKWVLELTARLPLQPLSLREATKHLKT